MNTLFKGFPYALGVAAYVSGIAWFLSSAERFFGNQEDTVFIPVFMLLLLIISATVTGLLVLGRPGYLYSEGRLREALQLLFSILAWLLVFLLIVASVMLQMA